MSLIVSSSATPRIVKNWPVLVHTAQDDGKVRKDEIFLDFEVIPQSEVDDVIKSAQDAGENINVALMRRTVKSINGMVDEVANTPIPFSDETFAQALDRSNQLSAMVAAFFDVQNGRKPARKNS